MASVAVSTSRESRARLAETLRRLVVARVTRIGNTDATTEYYNGEAMVLDDMASLHGGAPGAAGGGGGGAARGGGGRNRRRRGGGGLSFTPTVTRNVRAGSVGVLFRSASRVATKAGLICGPIVVRDAKEYESVFLAKVPQLGSAFVVGPVEELVGARGNRYAFMQWVECTEEDAREILFLRQIVAHGSMLQVEDIYKRLSPVRYVLARVILYNDLKTALDVADTILPSMYPEGVESMLEYIGFIATQLEDPELWRAFHLFCSPADGYGGDWHTGVSPAITAAAAASPPAYSTFAPASATSPPYASPAYSTFAPAAPYPPPRPPSPTYAPPHPARPPPSPAPAEYGGFGGGGAYDPASANVRPYSPSDPSTHPM